MEFFNFVVIEVPGKKIGIGLHFRESSNTFCITATLTVRIMRADVNYHAQKSREIQNIVLV